MPERRNARIDRLWYGSGVSFWVSIARLVRIRDWFYFLPLPLMSVRLEPLDWWGLVRGVALAAGCLAFAYGWNNLHDAGLDRSRLKNPLIGPAPELSRVAFRRVLLVIAAATVVAALLSPPVVAAAALAVMAAAAVYSGGQRLKRLPVVCTFMNLWIFTPLCFLGGDPTRGTPGFALFALTFALLLCQNQLLHEAGHAAEDRARGVRTTAQLLGTRRAVMLAAVLGLGAGGVMLALAWGRWSAALTAAPVLVLAAVMLSRPAGDLARLRDLQRLIGGSCGAAMWLDLACL